MSIKIRRIILAALLSGHAIVANAQNIVANGTFDSNTNGWVVTNASNPPEPPQWVNEDCCGAPGSGSAMHSSGLLGQQMKSSCMQIVGGSEYDFLVTIKLERSGASLPSDAYAELRWFPDSACSGQAMETLNFVYPFSDYGKNWLQRGTRMMAPPGAQSANLSFATGAGLSHFVIAHIDEVRLGATGSVPVNLQSFEVD